MSGRREMSIAGYPLTDQDLQRAWDAGAEADSIMDEALFTPPNSFNSSPKYQKAIVPLGYEFQASAANPNPSLIVVPSGTFGTALVAKPFRAIAALQTIGSIGGVPTLPTINPTSVGPSQVAATGLSCDYNPIIPYDQLVSAGDATHGRFDVLVIVLIRGTSVSGNRQFKDPTNGNVSEQSLTLATDPGIGFAYIPGTPSGSPVPPALPGDTSTTWFLALANIFIPAGFNPATTFLGSGGSYIQQAWTRGGIDPRKVKLYNDMQGQNFGATGITRDTAVMAMWQSPVRFVTGLHLPPSVGSTFVDIDASLDWRQRLIRIRAYRPTSQGSGTLYPSPEQVSVGGAPSNSVELVLWSGAGGHFVNGGSPPVSFQVDASTGHLQFSAAGGVTDGTNGDDYYIDVEGSPQFIGPHV